MSIEAKLAELGITLPSPSAPAANYVPFVRSGHLLVLSGQLCLGLDGKIAPEHKGKLGAEVLPRSAMRRLACAGSTFCAGQGGAGQPRQGDPLRPAGRLHQHHPHLRQSARVHDGASDLMVEVFGDKGRHARTTVGVAELPFDAVVEAEAIFEVA